MAAPTGPPIVQIGPGLYLERSSSIRNLQASYTARTWKGWPDNNRAALLSQVHRGVGPPCLTSIDGAAVTCPLDEGAEGRS